MTAGGIFIFGLKPRSCVFRGLPYILGQTSFLSVDRFALMADLYGVELLGRDLFFELSPLVAAVQHLQHNPGAEPEPADEHLALVEIVQL